MGFQCGKDMENLRTLKRILKLFELMSGLRVNFNKYKLFDINISSEDLAAGESLLGCGIERENFVYLGMKIGINNHRRENWTWLAQKLKNRIAH